MNGTIKAKIENYRAIAGLAPAIIRTIKKWDGKCYNKRFIDDLQTETGCKAYAQVDERYIHIQIIPNDKHTWSNWQHILTIKKTEDRRLHKDELITFIDEKAAELNRKANELEHYGDERIIDTIKQQIEIIRNLAGHCLDGVPNEIKDLYRLSTTIHIY